MVPRAVALLKRRIFGWGSCYISFPLPILQMLPVIGRPAPELTAFVPGLLGCGLHTKLTNSYRRGDGAAWWLYGATHLPTTRPFSPKRIFLLDSRSEDGQEQQQDFPSSVSNTWSLAGESGAGTTMNSTVGVNGGAIPATLPPVVGDIRRSTVDTLCVRPRSDESDAQAERGVPKGNFVELFRGSAPYIRAHRGAVMVVHMGGEVLEGPGFMSLMDDMGLLTLLGVKLVLVTGIRPQIAQLLRQAGIEEEFREDVRITSKGALKAIKAAAGFVRIEVESALTRGGRNGVSIHVSGGNFFSAQPVGVKQGVDYGCTGEVRKVDTNKIRSQLGEGGIVHLTCMGYSPSGEVFNVDTRDLAAKCAAALGASKIVYIADGAQLQDTVTEEVIKSIRLSEGRLLLARYRQNRGVPAEVSTYTKKASNDDSILPGSGTTKTTPEEGFMKLIERAVRALGEGVARAHIVPPTSGALLQELFTTDGAGLLISRDIYDGIRLADSRDIPGITEIITPLEEKGALVPRPREQLEAAIVRNEFFVITRDEAILGVASFKRFGPSHAEMGCMAIHPDYRKRGWGEAMLSYLERVALASRIKHLFVLSTSTMQWFVERGFEEADVSVLPPERRESYNWKRMSKIYIKTLGGGVREVDAEELLWNVQGMT